MRLPTELAGSIPITAGRAQVRQYTLFHAPHIRDPFFRAISVVDLRVLFDSYDRIFFGGKLARATLEAGAPLGLRIGSRLTRAAGVTSRRPTAPNAAAHRHEIAVSPAILFESFRVPGETLSACGQHCPDRLDALMRVFEHELCHLIEFLRHGRSSCRARPFHDLALKLFGHTRWTHDLMTPARAARERRGIAPGVWVVFDFQGRPLRGVVNRVTRRATVLVPDRAGRLMSDGKRYRLYYVPLDALETA